MTTEVTAHHETVSGSSTWKTTHKLIEATIDTDANGDGSITVDFSVASSAPAVTDDRDRSAFAGVPWIVLDETSDPAADVQNVTAESVDVIVSGSSTTDGTVTVRLLAHGEWARAG